MRKFKLLSIILALALIVGVMPSSVFAAGGDVTADSIPIDAEHFPDEAFRNYLLAFEKLTEIENSEYGMAPSGFNKDRYFQKAEIEKITRFNFDSDVYEGLRTANIANLKGIEYFTNLEELNCSNQKLTSLDVSKNKNLVYLDCVANDELTSITLANPKLEDLSCDYTGLSELDLSGSPLLRNFSAEKDPIDFDTYFTSIDFSKNTKLEEIDLSGNKLTSIDVSMLPDLEELDLENNKINYIDLTQNEKLFDLKVENNELTSLDVSKNTALKGLNIMYNNIPSIDLSQNIHLGEVIDSNSTGYIEIDDGGGEKINPLMAVDFSNQTNIAVGASLENSGNSIRSIADGTPLADLARYGFDASKAKNVAGGTFANGKFEFDEGSSEISYVYDDGNDKITDRRYIIAKATEPQYQKITGKPANVTDGWKDYYDCLSNGKYYEDAQGKKPIPDIEAWKKGAGRIPAGSVPTPTPTAKPDNKVNVEEGNKVFVGGALRDINNENGPAYGDAVYIPVKLFEKVDGSYVNAAFSDYNKELKLSADWEMNGKYVESVKLVPRIYTEGGQQVAGFFIEVLTKELPEEVDEVDIIGTVTLKGKHARFVSGDTEFKEKTIDVAFTVSNEKDEVATDDVTVGSTSRVYIFGKGFEEQTFNLYGNMGHFDVNTVGQSDLVLYSTVEYSKGIEAISPDYSYVYFNGNGASFNKIGTLYLKAKYGSELYKVMEDGTLKLIDGNYDTDEDAFKIRTRTLGSFVIAEKELPLEKINAAILGK